MSKLRTKVAILVATLALAMGCMTAPAFAATIGPSDAGVSTSTDTTLNIVKTLKVSNPDLIQVAGPGLQLSYTVAPATVAAGTVIDDGTHTATVHPGPQGGLTLTSAPAFTATELLNASAAGTDNTKNIVLATDLTKFLDPGVYRYILTDTTPANDLTAAGVTRSGNFDNVRYVDVYVQMIEGQLQVEGYVVGSDLDRNGVLAKETFDTSTTTEDTTAQTYEVRPTPDVFTTYNVALRKSVTGSMGDRHNEFPFAISVSDRTRAYYSAENTAPSSSSTLNQAAGTTSLSVTLKDGDVYYIAGLTANDTVAYTETNNTTDTYSVTYSGVTGTTDTATNVQPNGTKAMPAATAPNAENVTFTNNLGSVSPTGVIMRFGPYVGMVLIAILLIALRRRARANK